MMCILKLGLFLLLELLSKMYSSFLNLPLLEKRINGFLAFVNLSATNSTLCAFEPLQMRFAVYSLYDNLVAVQSQISARG